MYTYTVENLNYRYTYYIWNRVTSGYEHQDQVLILFAIA